LPERLTEFPGSHGERQHTATGSACTPGSAHCLARDRGNQGVIGVLISYHYEITLACWRQAFRPLHPRPTSTDGPSYGASNSSFLRNHNRILASSSQSGRPLLSHIVEGASDPRLPRVRVPAPLATLFTPNRVPSWELSPRVLPAHLASDVINQLPGGQAPLSRYSAQVGVPKRKPRRM